MRSLTLTAALVATLLSTAVAAVAEPAAEDWRAAACIDEGQVDAPGPSQSAAPSGPSSVVASSRVTVDGLPGVQVGVDRLDFSGVTCEVFYVQGALPRDAVVDVLANSWCASFAVVLGGEEQPHGRTCSSSGSPTRLYARGWYDVPDDVLVLAVSSFRAHDSQVLEDEPGLPPKWVGATLTSDHTGSTWRVVLAGTTGVRREFDRSQDTDRAARAAYARQVRRAGRTYDERVARIEQSHRSLSWKAWRLQQAASVRKDALAVARKKQRLALTGIHLTVRSFRSSNRGTLPPAA